MGKVKAIYVVPYYWYELMQASEYWGVTTKEILDSGNKKTNPAMARQIFYWLCYKKGMNIYKLAKALGRDRTAVHISMKRSVKKEVLFHVNKIIQNDNSKKVSRL